MQAKSQKNVPANNCLLKVPVHYNIVLKCFIVCSFVGHRLATNVFIGRLLATRGCGPMMRGGHGPTN